MKRRIVLSDDEDAGEMLASADISNVMQGKPSPPVSAKSDGKDSKKPVKKRSARFNPDIDSADDEDDDDNDDDDDDGDESYDDDEDDERSKQRTAHKKSKKSSPENVSTAPRRKPSSRSSAARSSSSSSAKRLQEQRQELKRRGNGLKGVDSDSDEYSDDGEEKFTFSASGNRPSSLPRLSSGGGSSSVQSFFRGGNRDNDPLPRKKTRKAKTPEPSSDEDDNLDNFILNSDEEREEEEERQKALKRQRQKEKRLRQQKKDERDRQRSSESKPKKRSVTAVDEDDDDGKVVASGGRARSGGSSGKRRIRDEEDEEDEGEEEVPGPIAKSSKRRQVANSEGDDDEDGNKEEEEEDVEEDSDVDNDDDDDDDDDSVEQEDDALDGPMLYWQVDAAREKQHESQVTDAMPIRKNFPTPEALRLYIEMLANAHVDKDFVSRIVKSPHTSPNSSYVAAARQIENKICTIRESMVGSGAWNVKFMSELSKRPFYICSPASFYGLHEKCSACNRASKSTVKQIYLFGACYNAQRAWTSQRWDNEIPETAFLHRTQNDEIVELSSSEDEDNEEDEDEENDDIGDEESRDKDRSKLLPKACVWWKSKWPGALTSGKESRWMLSGHCCNRTQLYHTLLHYKLRLFLKVREKLERVGGSVGEAMRDASFISNEVTRYEKLLDTASKLYGGKDMESEFQSDVWGNEIPSDFATPSSQGRRSIGQSNTRGGSLDGQADGGNGGILGWIKKGQQ